MSRIVTEKDLQAAISKLWAGYLKWKANDLIKPGPPRGFKLVLEMEHDEGHRWSHVEEQRAGIDLAN